MLARLQAAERDCNVSSVTLQLNTSGGDGWAMFALCDQIRAMETKVITIVDHAALSAGCLVAAAGHERRARAHSRLLFHSSWNQFGSQKSRDNVADAAEHHRFDQMMCEFMAQRTLKPFEHWKAIISSAEDRWFSAADALEWGVVDSIIGEWKST
jgi:ATP-dependent Clp protease, protease subunit